MKINYYSEPDNVEIELSIEDVDNLNNLLNAVCKGEKSYNFSGWESV